MKMMRVLKSTKINKQWKKCHNYFRYMDRVLNLNQKYISHSYLEFPEQIEKHLVISQKNITTLQYQYYPTNKLK